MSGRRVALTGTIEDIGRTGFKNILLAEGDHYVASLEDGADLLVLGDKPLANKVEQARNMAIAVVTWEAFCAARATAEASRAAPARDDLGVGPPAVEWSRERVRLLDVTVRRRAEVDADDLSLVPLLATFDHYTLDAPTALLLRALARAVRLGQPCLVEGETATSKTSAVLYLAALVGQPVVRLNLNGQTDVSELVGRYVPEGAGWRFQEGLVPTAMRRGWWLILDEVNLAEPAVLERLNPALERSPSLIITEGDGARLGPGGAPVHPAFRVFATMNPAEYQGRSALSPAWRDRFVSSFAAVAPGEADVRQMLERLIFARQPSIEALGLSWSGSLAETAPYGVLAGVEGIDGLIRRVAAVHAAMVAMAGSADGQGAAIGAHRRERVVFTRRALLGCLDAWRDLTLEALDGPGEVGFVDAPARLICDALECAYVDRVRGDDDKARVLNVLRSMGLTRDAWVDPFAS